MDDEFRKHVTFLLQGMEDLVYKWMLKYCEETKTEPAQVNEKQFIFLFYRALQIISSPESLEATMAQIDSENERTTTWN